MTTHLSAPSRTLRFLLAPAVAVSILASCSEPVRQSQQEACAAILNEDPAAHQNPVIVIADTTASVNRVADSSGFDDAVSAASLATKDVLLLTIDGAEARQVGRGRLSSDTEPRSVTRANEAKAMPGCLRNRIIGAATAQDAVGSGAMHRHERRRV